MVNHLHGRRPRMSQAELKYSHCVGRNDFSQSFDVNTTSHYCAFLCPSLQFLSCLLLMSLFLPLSHDHGVPPTPPQVLQPIGHQHLQHRRFFNRTQDRRRSVQLFQSSRCLPHSMSTVICCLIVLTPLFVRWCRSSAVQLTRVLASQLIPYKIRVNAILPGLFPTEMTGQTSNEHMDNSPMADFYKAIPVGESLSLSRQGPILW